MDTYMIEKQLRNKGFKLTGQRVIIIDILQNSAGPCTAQEVYQAAIKSCNINFSTIYRNLELLSKLRIVTKLNIRDGVSHFEISGIEHKHHAICKGCGDVKILEYCPIHDFDNSKLKQLGFTPTEHKFEIYGYCNKCSSEKDK